MFYLLNLIHEWIIALSNVSNKHIFIVACICSHNITNIALTGSIEASERVYMQECNIGVILVSYIRSLFA